MRGILFKPDMIKAIAEGRKTQTRRAMQNQPTLMDKVYEKDFRRDFGARKPRYRVGETVYIKEAWTYITLAEKDPWKDRAEKDGSFRRMPDGSPVSVWYKSSGVEIGTSWSTPLFMPAWAARYFIQITDVRPERLQEITEKEAEAEGIDPSRCIDENYLDFPAVKMFARLWDSINKPPYDWNSNPFVFVYSFRMVRDAK